MKRIKKICIIFLALIVAFTFSACEAGKSVGIAEKEKTSGTDSLEGYPTFSYTHFASGGTQEDYTAVILFEQDCSTFTAYQVAYSSCTCRDSIVNYYSVCYVELLNTKASEDMAAIRTITFGDNKGLWGDSNPNYYHHEYTQEYYDEHLVQPFVGVTMSEVNEWQGYGTAIDAVDFDALSGATVSTSNLTSMLQGLFEYHGNKYYAE